MRQGRRGRRGRSCRAVGAFPGSSICRPSSLVLVLFRAGRCGVRTCELPLCSYRVLMVGAMTSAAAAAAWAPGSANQRKPPKRRASAPRQYMYAIEAQIGSYQIRSVPSGIISNVNTIASVGGPTADFALSRITTPRYALRRLAEPFCSASNQTLHKAIAGGHNAVRECARLSMRGRGLAG